MLRILGSPKSLCDGRTRREFVQAGMLGALGLGLVDWLRGRVIDVEGDAVRVVGDPVGVHFNAGCAVLLFVVHYAGSGAS